MMAVKTKPVLSDRQKQVLSLIDERLTIKEIAGALQISETRVNQHIEMLKRRLDANTHRELAARYRELSAVDTATPFPNSSGGKSELPDGDESLSFPSRVADGELSFADAHAFSMEAPWARVNEPLVVPPALDGNHAVLARLAVVAVIVFGLLASLVLIITAADSLSEVVGSRPDTQLTN